MQFWFVRIGVQVLEEMDSDFRIGDQCKGNAVLGDNTSGYDGSTFLVGERTFTVAEIEVFEIRLE
jgi:hypothetical protein